MILQTGAQVADKAVQGILSRVDQLAEKLGTTAANVWTIYVAQARVEAIRDSFIGLVFLVGSVVAFFVSRFLLKKTDEDEAFLVGGSIVAFASLALLGISLAWMYPAIGEWMNPQFWAFQNITADIKGLL